MKHYFIPYNQIDYYKNNSFFLKYINNEINQLYSKDFSINTILNNTITKSLSDALCDKLYEYNTNFLPDKSTEKSIKKLKLKGCTAIITGQQPHLYIGPLYTVYKILTAIKLSDLVEKETGKPCVPLFWNGSDDHDLDEVNKAVFPSFEQGLIDLKLELINKSLPIYSYDTLTEYEKLNNIVFSKINNTDFTPFIKDLFSQHLNSISSQFTYSIKKLFYNKRLIVLEPKILRPFCGEIYKNIILNDKTINSLIDRNNQNDLNFIKRDQSSNLFYDKNTREKILIDQDRYVFNGKKYLTNDFADFVLENREYFSPNVALRPVVQDYFFPTISYVAGPGECSYFSQLKDVYNLLNVNMPSIFPRASATLITTRESRIIEKYSFDTINVLNKNIDVPENEIIKEHHDIFNIFYNEILQKMNGFSDYALSISKEVFESLNGPYRKIEFELKRIENKFIKDCEKSTGIYRGQIEKLKYNLIPKNNLQERVFTPLYYLNLYGIELIDKLYETLDFTKFEHQIIYLN